MRDKEIFAVNIFIQGQHVIIIETIYPAAKRPDCELAS